MFFNGILYVIVSFPQHSWMWKGQLWHDWVQLLAFTQCFCGDLFDETIFKVHTLDLVRLSRFSIRIKICFYMINQVQGGSCSITTGPGSGSGGAQ